MLEILGQEGKKGRLKLQIYPKKWIASRCHISEEKLSSMLDFMSDISLCCPKSLKNKELYVPKFKERADDYTKRMRRLSEQDTDSVRHRLDKIRIDKIRKEYIRIKGISEEDLTGSDYGRYTKEIKKLALRRDFSVEEVIRRLNLLAKEPYNWTLETLDKKWLELGRPRENINSIDNDIQKSLGNIATIPTIVKLLERTPGLYWNKIRLFLKKRYPADGEKVYSEAEKTLAKSTAKV